MTTEDIERRIEESAESFRNLVWPQFSDSFRGELVPVETVTDSTFTAMLDRRAGIDAWLLRPKAGPVIGIASRVQPADHSWDTFTVRMRRPRSAYPQEYERLVTARSTAGAISPRYWLQAYIDESRTRLHAAAIVPTEDLLLAVEKGVGGERSNPADGTIFHWVPWNERNGLQWHNGRIKTVRPDHETTGET